MLCKKSMLKGLLSAGVALACAAGLLWSQPTMAQEPQKGGTLRVSFPGSPRLIDPPITGSVEEWIVTSWLYNNLTRVDEKFNVQPDLAVSWEPAEAGKVWTFKLRPGVKFASGKDMTADDVVASINRILDPNTKSRGKGGLGPIEKVEAVDPLTVRFTLARPIADFASNLALPYARIMPKGAKLNFNIEADGTGPFILKEFVVGEKVVVERNPNYFVKGLPHVDRVVLTVYPDSTAELNALKDGKTDIVWQVRPDQVTLLSEAKDIKVEEIATGSFVPVVMRSDQPPFNDARVRKALKLSIERETMVKNILGGHGAIGNDQSLPPTNPFFNKDVKPARRDIAAAKKLLAEAGHANGLKATLYTSDARVGMLPQALLVQQMAKEAGFDIQIQNTPWDVFLNTVWEKRPFYINNWFARPTTDTSILPFFTTRDKGGSLNDYYYSNAQVDELLLAAQAELDVAKRRELYNKAQAVISEDGPAIIAFFKNNITAFRTDVMGYTADPGINLTAEKIWLKR
ncbi:MAG: ABC transporter substrate-binding protein [Hyphomicrobiaceae bacterium]|nr:ABC transporter substrate-binding protein [Hyphomicrobiaceae bacterium]